jgi:hypothetical protein
MRLQLAGIGIIAALLSWQRVDAQSATGCVFGPGDGLGTAVYSYSRRRRRRRASTNLGSAANEAKCIAKVMQQQPSANGATFSGDHDSSGTCYAEFSMTGRRNYGGWQTCQLAPELCTWVPGDGTGGSQTSVGNAATTSECLNLVLSTQPQANSHGWYGHFHCAPCVYD